MLLSTERSPQIDQTEVEWSETAAVWSETAAPSHAAESYVPASPFSESFQLGESFQPGGAAETESGPAPTTDTARSPFRAEYMGELSERGQDGDRAHFEALVAQLHSEAFDEAVYELAAEAAAERLDRLGESEAATASESQAFLESYLAPLASETEGTFERLAEQYARHDISNLDEAEVDRLFETMQPSMGHLTPAFENFFKALWRKARSVASTVIGAAKTGLSIISKITPLGFIFNKLKSLVRPLLKRVLQYALGRLPAVLQPAAQRLATRLFGESEQEALQPEAYAESTSSEQLAAADVVGIQREVDARLASLFFARDAGEQEALEAEAEAANEAQAEDRETELEVARETFVNEVTHLPRGQDPTAQMENFLPAVMAALKLGIGIIGRQRVVGFLAGYLAGVVRPYVGVAVAKPLADAIVSTGMGVIGLEAPAERETLAGEAVANAVEGTLRRLAEHGPNVWTEQSLLEAAVQEAFSAAAAESFPPAMVREELNEVSPRAAVRGTWVLRPARGRRRYKRYTTVLDVTLTAQTASVIEGFGCMPLRSMLKARFGVTAPVRAKAYLFEAVAGTTISAIARHERALAGLGTTATRPWQMFVPLTKQTAGLLFGEPELGRDTDTQFVVSHRRIAVGQRFVVLVPEGTRAPRPVQPGLQAVPSVRTPLVARPSQVDLTLDLPRLTATASLYLSDADTQSVAASLRRGESATSTLLMLRSIYVAPLRSMLSGATRRPVKVVHETAVNEQYAGAALSTVAPSVMARVGRNVLGFVDQALADYFSRRRQEFIAVADKTSGGVTLVVTVRHPTIFSVLGRALRGDAVGATPALARAALVPPDVVVRALPGSRP